ncbi:MAG: hypothetical protein MK101_08675 [Phycisphaerales bacterium]|nr:hypothetical protein [Phycisphaerales bacterium]
MRAMLRNLGWGMYGASAWTWCIGMYLPVLLMQWYGWWGFVLIAVPNVIGCTWMGWRLRTADASRTFCRRHATAIRWFAIATVGFQLLFLSMVTTWFLPETHPLISNLYVVPLLAFALAWLLAMLPRALWPWLGVATFVVSMSVLGVRLDEGFTTPTPTRDPIDVIWLAPIFCLGFGLSPWLDAPFHQTLQATDDRRAFLVVGVAFFLLLFITATYSRLGPELMRMGVLVHVLVQSIFTLAANLREVSPAGVVGGRAGISLMLPLLAPLLPWATGLLMSDPWNATWHTYLRFLALYAVVFPGIVLFRAMGPPWPLRPGRIALIIVAMVAAAACAETGLLHGPAWAAMGSVVILLVLWRLGRPTEASTS